uniref:C-type lectin-like n=1 Tax=Styela clava TaxID=7725 RepID=UPI00193A2232|nr:C-type lectin-like [Styela clava]
MGSRVQEHERSVDEKLSMYKGSNRDNSQENIENVENIAKIVERVVKKRSENKYKDVRGGKYSGLKIAVVVLSIVTAMVMYHSMKIANDFDRKFEELQKEFISTRKKSEADLINVIASLSGWYRASNNLFYKWFSEEVHYQTARNRCEQLGARLISTGIRDSKVRSEIHSKICIPDTRMWIGLDHIERENWVWSDGTIVNDIRRSVPWRNGEPNNEGRFEFCGEYLCGKLYNGVNDQWCFSEFAYVCEKAFYHEL